VSDVARFQFWSDPQKWPNDFGEGVFLARALHEIGQLVYEHRWTGKEPLAPSHDSRDLPPLSELDEQQRHDIRQALIATGSWGRADSSEINVEPPEITPEDYEAARELSRQFFVHHQRFLKARAILGSGIAEGHVVSMLRAVTGGRYRPVEKEDWYAESWGARFTMCLMNPLLPFSSEIFSLHHMHIFVTRESLDAYKAALVSNSGPDADLPAPLSEDETPQPTAAGRVYDDQEGIQFLEAQDQLYLADKGPRYKHKEWVQRVAPDKFPGMGPKQAVRIWKNAKLSPSFRGTPGRPAKDR
jgi:hypothetical protein